MLQAATSFIAAAWKLSAAKISLASEERREILHGVVVPDVGMEVSAATSQVLALDARSDAGLAFVSAGIKKSEGAGVEVPEGGAGATGMGAWGSRGRLNWETSGKMPVGLRGRRRDGLLDDHVLVHLLLVELGDL